MSREALDTYAVGPNVDPDVISAGEQLVAFEHGDCFWALQPLLEPMAQQKRAILAKMQEKGWSELAQRDIRHALAWWLCE